MRDLEERQRNPHRFMLDRKVADDHDDVYDDWVCSDYYFNPHDDKGNVDEYDDSMDPAYEAERAFYDTMMDGARWCPL